MPGKKSIFHFKSGKWYLQAAPDDGARITRLAYDGFDLLTPAPSRFRPPKRDYGLYETRPVGGYDDCFPSVETCRFPGRNWRVPDHGELCWLPWTVQPARGGLRFTVQSQRLPLTFSRTMIFSENRLTWQFEVKSGARGALPFQHIMHPLMPLDQIYIAGSKLPPCGIIYDETSKKPLKRVQAARSGSAGIRAILESIKPGEFRMLILRNVKSGNFILAFKNGICLKVKFPRKYFNSLGIWWNNRGYPDEPGIRRCECAFEPIPGPASSLARSVRSGDDMIVLPGQNLAWNVVWEITR